MVCRAGGMHIYCGCCPLDSVCKASHVANHKVIDDALHFSEFVVGHHPLCREGFHFFAEVMPKYHLLLVTLSLHRA